VKGQLIVLDQASGLHLTVSQQSNVTASSVAVNGVQNTNVAQLNSGVLLKANTITLEGSLNKNGGSTSGTVTQNTGTATADPLAGLTPPAVPTAAPTPHKGVYYPGHYTTAVTFSGTSCLTPGTYYIDASWTVAAGASLLGYNTGSCPTTSGDPGVLLYFHSGSFTVVSQGGVGYSSTKPLLPMSSGAYAGLLFWQDKTDTATTTIQANANVYAGGAWYEPAAKLVINDNSGAVAMSRLIVNDLAVGANDALTVQ
jgi:hypothetical protein